MTELNEAIDAQAHERVAVINRAMAKLGLADDDDEAYDVLDEMYSKAWYSGQGWEHRYPS